MKTLEFFLYTLLAIATAIALAMGMATIIIT